MTTLTQRLVVDDDELAGLRAPRTDLLRERVGGPDDFGIDRGPFERYRRTLEVTPRDDGRHDVVQRIDYRLAVRYWRWLLHLPVRWRIQRPGEKTPWWAPPDVVDARAAVALSTLTIVAIIGGYLSTLIGQTMTFAADEFGSDERAQGFALGAVRIGAVIALAMVAVADRRGRRIVLVGACALGITASATGALAPDLTTLTLSQIVGRSFATTLVIIVPILAAEEMPSGSRAYALGLLALCSSLGSGFAVMALPLADLGERAWRLIYLVPLLALPVVRNVWRNLPESRRYEAHAADRAGRVRLGQYRGRLALLALTGFLLNVFVAPAAQFRNRFLDDERGFSATEISGFTLLTSTPAGIGVVLGSQLADRWARKPVAAFGFTASAVLTAAFYLSDGFELWLFALSGTILGAFAVPAFKVYEPEMFPTRLRGRANGIITAVTLVGSVTGLVTTGLLTDPLGGLGQALAVVCIGGILAATLILLRFPETANEELEAINPADRDDREVS